MIRAALAAIPRGEPVIAAVAPGNAASLRAFLARRFRRFSASVQLLRRGVETVQQLPSLLACPSQGTREGGHSPMDLDRGPAGSEVTRLDLVAAAGVGHHVDRCHRADPVGQHRCDRNVALPRGRSGRTWRARGTQRRASRRERASSSSRLEPACPCTSTRTPSAAPTVHSSRCGGRRPRCATRRPARSSVRCSSSATRPCNARRRSPTRPNAIRDGPSWHRPGRTSPTWNGSARIAQALSSTLDEREVLERLARLVVGRLADIAVTDMISERAVVERVGRAVASGVDIDIDALLAVRDIGCAVRRGLGDLPHGDVGAAVHIRAGTVRRHGSAQPAVAVGAGGGRRSGRTGRPDDRARTRRRGTGPRPAGR